MSWHSESGACDQLITSQPKKAVTEKFESPAKNVSRTRDPRVNSARKELTVTIRGG